MENLTFSEWMFKLIGFLEISKSHKLTGNITVEQFIEDVSARKAWQPVVQSSCVCICNSFIKDNPKRADKIRAKNYVLGYFNNFISNALATGYSM